MFSAALAAGGNWTLDEYEVLAEIIQRYVDESAVTCEYCGAPGRLREARSIHETLCDACDAHPHTEHNSRAATKQ